jgi:AraC-like DNA-binding protein
MSPPQQLPALVRPEWLFEVANYIQGLVCSQHPVLVEAKVRKIWPPESAFERQLLNAMVAQLEVSSLAYCADGQALRNSPRAKEQADGRDFKRDRAKLAAEEAADLIRSHPAGHWTPAVLARRTHCNRTQLQAAFRSRWLYSIHTYLNICRIGAAKTLLRSTVWRLDAIAKEIGYRSKVSLFANFRLVLDMTPDAYRQRWAQTLAKGPVIQLAWRPAQLPSCKT